MTPEQFLEAAEGLARNFFDNAGECPYCALILANVDPTTGKSLDVPGLVPILARPGNSADKDRLATMVKGAAVAFEASGVAMLTEVWMVEGPISEEERARLDRKGLSGHPNRIERVFISVEHLGSKGPVMRYANIDRSEEKPKLGPWQSYGEAVEMEGRFADFMQKRRFS